MYQDSHILKRLVGGLSAWVNFTSEKTNESGFRFKSHGLRTGVMEGAVTKRKRILRAFFKRKRFIKFQVLAVFLDEGDHGGPIRENWCGYEMIVANAVESDSFDVGDVYRWTVSS